MDIKGMQKGVLWEIAKGHLRAMVIAGGSSPCTDIRSPDWEMVSCRVEAFIKEVEDDELHE